MESTNVKRILLLLFLPVLPAGPAAAQHTHPAAPADTARAAHAAHGAAPAADAQAHGMSGVLGIPQTREGSGTSWLPDATPMHAVHGQAGAWSLMLHGQAFLQYIDEGSDRGDDQLGSINWIMGMARRPFGGGEVTLRAMLSAEPWTVGDCGYPDLLATGETCNGEPLHDRQHPHDLFMELAAGYQRALSDDLGLELYGGLAAEPALGPTAYPHRVSAFPGPLAPISHHWLDATHITFGSLTAGLFGRAWKAEASLFNGREPDEDRFDLDLDALDSYSGRLSFMPTSNWMLQVSAGQLNEAEPGHAADDPRVDVTRYTASAIYHRPVGGTGLWASTVAWGHNVEDDVGTNALLAETSLNLADRHILSGRAEWVEKAGHDLVLADHDLEDEIFSVAKVGVGYTLQLPAIAQWTPGIGAGVSMSFLPDELEPDYGDTNPFGVVVFGSIRPAAMRMGGAAHAPTPVGSDGAHARPSDGRTMPAQDAHADHAQPRPQDAHAGHAQPQANDAHAGHAAAAQQAHGVHGAMPTGALTVDDVRTALQARGITPGHETEVQQPFWAVPTTVIQLPAARTPHAAVHVNVYAASMAVHEDATKSFTTMPSWVAPPHFFHVRNVLLVLLADPAQDAQLVADVEALVKELGGMRMHHEPGASPH